MGKRKENEKEEEMKRRGYPDPSIPSVGLYLNAFKLFLASNFEENGCCCY